MEKNGCRGSLMLCLVLLIALLVSNVPLGSTSFLQEAAAEKREYEVSEFEQTLTIATDAFEAIDVNFVEGKELEVVFALQVKDNLAIDVWFVNEDHYMLLSSGGQFLFYVDGSDSQISYTKKIVTLTEHDLYKLVVTNYYSNQTVEVDVAIELRTYYGKSSETDYSTIILYSLLVLVIILAALLVVLLFKTRGYKRAKPKATKKVPSKKGKSHKTKKTKTKKPKVIKKEPSKEAEEAELELTEEELLEEEGEPEVSAGFCGYCGKPVTTPYCTNCGREVKSFSSKEQY